MAFPLNYFFNKVEYIRIMIFLFYIPAVLLLYYARGARSHINEKKKKKGKTR